MMERTRPVKKKGKFKGFTFKGRILAGLRKDIKKHRESSSWLQDAIPFNPDYYLSVEHKAISNQLFDSLDIPYGYKPVERQRDFEILIANLLHQTRKPIRVSLDKNDWKQTRYNKASYFIAKEYIDVLNQNKLIDMKLGYKFEKDSRKTRIWATDELLEIFPEYKNGIFDKPSELVILRDAAGKPKEYKDTAETWRVREILQQINEINEKANIRFEKYKLNNPLVAIYKEKFTWYGRLHTSGYSHYQSLSGDERKEITINGDPVVELDFSGMGINLLYAAEKKQLQSDPYLAIDARPEVRPFLKHILICMLNAKDETKAEKAAIKWLYDNHREREKLKSIGITQVRPLIDKFLKVHKDIAHNFCKGKDTGMRVMNKDSKIALDIVHHFAKQNIPILCIHDSFIVQKHHQSELYQTMKKVYHKHTGFDVEIK